MYNQRKAKDMDAKLRDRDMLLILNLLVFSGTQIYCYQLFNMDDNLRITSLNCYGIKTSLYQVYELCEKSAIVFLQETLLFTHELSILSILHPDFEDMGVSAIDRTSCIISGRPFGGVAILIRKKLRQYCNFLFYADARIIGLSFYLIIYIFLMFMYLINAMIIMTLTLSI